MYLNIGMFQENIKTDIIKSVSSHYEKFRVFYEDPSLYDILIQIQKECENIIVLSDITPAFSSIKYKGKEVKPVFDERTSKFLFEYYILKVFTNYIDLAENDRMVVREVTKKMTVEDLVTVEYLDDLETAVDFESSRKVQDITIT